MAVDLKPVSVIEMDFGLEPYGDAHNAFAGECMRRMDKYVPMDTGTLRNEAYVRKSDCSIVYNQVYAGYQYYGQRKDGSHKVNPENYSTKQPVMTGPYWDKVMVSAESQDLVKFMKDYFKGR